MARDYGVTSDSLTPVALEGGHPIITKPGALPAGKARPRARSWARTRTAST